MGACSSIPSIEQRHQIALNIAAEKAWQETELPTSSFALMSFSLPASDSTKHITVYLEGDGFAWVSRSQISLNPTPITPLALKLAMAQQEGRAIYLARPCQYLWQDDLCEKKYWTSSRFSSVVVDALDEALTQLKQQHGAEKITLVGYSGGASLAALLAAKRGDISKFVTVAGNLDHVAWTTSHKLSPLTNSLDPVDYIDRLQGIKQVHFVGENDAVIPPSLTKKFVASYQDSSSSQVIMMNGFTHACCWVEQWPALWSKIQY